MPQASLPWRHLLLALAVVAVWGSNFVVIKAALAQLPPLTFALLRFCLALLPAVFFLRRPAVPWRHLAAYGVLIGAGQFGLLFIAMDGHISPRQRHEPPVGRSAPARRVSQGPGAPPWAGKGARDRA